MTTLDRLNRDIRISPGGEGIVILPGPVDGFLWLDGDKWYVKTQRDGQSERHVPVPNWTQTEDGVLTTIHKTYLATLIARILYAKAA